MKNFHSDTSGAFAILMALLLVPLMVAVGFIIDGTRWYNAKAALQNAADLTSLAIAASPEQDVQILRANAERFLQANLSDTVLAIPTVNRFEGSLDSIMMQVSSEVPSTFMRMFGFGKLTISAFVEARRAPVQEIEVALVLDNTYSMSGTMPSGQTRMQVLKTAATNLVNTLLPSSDNGVNISVIPYAANVNVGIENRSAAWLSVKADYSTTKTTAGKCTVTTTKSECTAYAPKYSCTKYNDGLPYTATCGGNCITTNVVPVVPPITTCTSDSTSTTNYKWNGCIGSRVGSNYRLHDGAPSVPYPGIMDSSSTRQCMSPMIELTNDKSTLLNAIKVMDYKSGSYQPQTYMPAGLIWGQNALSPSEPFDGGGDYDDENKSPRKIMILMTDGDNTMKFNSDGTHSNISNDNSKTAKQVDPAAVAKVNNESLQICNYSKSKHIEVYTVAFMVQDDDSKALLSSCATDKAHFFDAANSAQLIASFDGIARSISQVRLAR